MAQALPLWVWVAVIMVGVVSEEDLGETLPITRRAASIQDRMTASTGSRVLMKRHARSLQSKDRVLSLGPEDLHLANAVKSVNSAGAPKHERVHKGGDLAEAESAYVQSVLAASRLELTQAVARADRLTRGIGHDLGESNGVGSTQAGGAGDPELQALKDKMKAFLKQEVERHNLEGEKDKAQFKESVRKGNLAVKTADEKAAVLVPAAEALYASLARSKKRAAEKRYKATNSEDMQKLRNQEAEIMAEKNKARLAAENKQSKVSTDSDKKAMEEKEKFLLKSSEADRLKAQQISAARQQAEEGKFKVREIEKSARGDSKLKSEAEQKQFASRKNALRERSQKMIKKLQVLEGRSASDAENRYHEAVKAEEDAVKRAKEMKKQAHALFKEEMAKAHTTMKELRSDVGEAKTVKRKFAKEERKAQIKTDREMKELKEERNGGMIKLKDGLQTIKDKEHMEERAVERKGNLTDTEYKQKQLDWMARAQTNAVKNCDDAKKEATLESQTAGLSISRNSRFVTDEAETEEHQRDDIHRVTVKLNDSKEKAAKNLRAVVKKAAIEMSASGETKQPEVDLVKQAATRFATKKLPADREMVKLKAKTKDAKDAKETAAKKGTKDWVVKKGLADKEKFKQKARKVCNSQQRWFQRVRHRVRKRLGTSTEKEQKAVAKGEFQEESWADNKAKTLIEQEKAIEEQAVKAGLKDNSEQKQKHAMREKAEKTRLQNIAERTQKLKEKAAEHKAKATIKLKDTIDLEDSKVVQARKMKDMAERDRKAAEASARNKETSEKTTLKAKREVALKSLRKQKEKAMKSVKPKRNYDEQLRKVREKSREMKRKAEEQERTEADEGKQKAVAKAAQDHAAARDKTEEIKQALQGAASEADRRLLQAKFDMAKEHAEAKKVMMESIRDGVGKKEGIAKAKQAAADIRAQGKNRKMKIMSTAHAHFERKIGKETKTALEHTKKAEGQFVQKIGKSTT